MLSLVLVCFFLVFLVQSKRTRSWHLKIKKKKYVPGLRFLVAVFKHNSTYKDFFSYKSKMELAAIFLFIDHLLLCNSKEILLLWEKISSSESKAIEGLGVFYYIYDFLPKYMILFHLPSWCLAQNCVFCWYSDRN